MPKIADAIDNSADIIDSRDVIARIDYLESERETVAETETTAPGALTLQEWDEGDEGEELKALKALADEASGSADWQHGEALIRDSYFEDYARDLAEDIYGRELGEAKWPFTCIDWEEAADQLKQDYFSVDFAGVTYWIRS